MKAIIPVAGIGSRMLPITKSVPKELLPVGSKPILQYILEGLVDAGIQEVVLVISPRKYAIQQYFGRSVALEKILKEKNKEYLLKELNSIKEKIHINYVIQNEQLGLGDAIIQAKQFIQEDYTWICMGDVIFPSQVYIDMHNLHINTTQSTILVKKIERSQMSNYGVIKSKDNIVESAVEKPGPDSIYEPIGILGMYILDSGIFSILERLKRSRNVIEELQLTDAIHVLAQSSKIVSHYCEYEYWDTGRPELRLLANTELEKLNYNVRSL